jgi:small subunit ribosomal protein S6e
VLARRLVTPVALQRKRSRKSHAKRQQEKNKAEAAEYQKLLVQRLREQRERR